jgi:hypothetical protein
MADDNQRGLFTLRIALSAVHFSWPRYSGHASSPTAAASLNVPLWPPWPQLNTRIPCPLCRKERKMKKKLKYHITELEKRVQRLSRAMMQDTKTLDERNRLESELRVAQPASLGDDRDLGLWIDYEMLRKHQGRPPQILINDPVSAPNNRYLQLADLAFGNGKAKKKSNGSASSD